MAEAGIFIGWGANVSGREEQGLAVFNEAIQYWGGLEEDGKIESFEVVLLTPHGGDLEGFALLRGSREQVSALLMDEEFERMNTRASLHRAEPGRRCPRCSAMASAARSGSTSGARRAVA